MTPQIFTPSKRLLGAAVLLTLLTPAAHAAATDTFSLDLNASDGSRWFDFFSDAFGELGLSHLTPSIPGDPNSPLGPTPPVGSESTPGTNDGFFQIATFFTQLDPDPLTANANQFGAANIFVNDNDFSDSYSITLDSAITGVGSEVRDIAGFDADFAQDIADGDAIVNSPYTTTVTAVDGTASFLDGNLTSLDFTADLTFTYDFRAFPFPEDFYSESGSIVFSGDTFQMLVADPGFEPDDPAEQLDSDFNLVLGLDGQPLGPGSGDDDDERDPVISGSFPEPDFAWDVFGVVENVGVPAAAGDYDNSGVVDVDDYALWAEQFGSPSSDADGNGDSTINAADYVIWRDLVSAPPAPIVAFSIPEPAAAGLLSCFAVVAAGFARSPRRARR
ncbi:MAG: hypothetical protein AAF596_00275 [Planctomycetota bacterium]